MGCLKINQYGDQTMITLYGFAISNYYNKVKFALLEKEIEFSEELTRPSQDPSLLEKSPLGKIPFIKTPEGYLSESEVILEYLEDAYPTHPLFPNNPYERAKTREFIQHLEMNVEMQARRLYGEVLFGTTISQEIKDEVKVKLDIGLKGLSKLIKLSPFAFGENFTIADVVAWPHFQLIGFVTDKIYGKDLVQEHIPAIEAYIKLIESRRTAQKVSQDRATALEMFFASMKAG